MSSQLIDWLIKYPSTSRNTDLSLICFPFAGGGTVNYARWRADLNEEIDLYAFNLPGRERFFTEQCLTDYQALVKSIALLIKEQITTPVIFFGHSFGGLTAYFSALELKIINGFNPVHVFISARLPPSTENILSMSHLNKEQFTSMLITRYQGIPKEIQQSPELLNLFIPIIQHDFKLYEQYPKLYATYEEKQLDSDLTTVGFTEDNIQESAFKAWEQFTKGSYKHIQLTGGHFEILTNWKEITNQINQSRNNYNLRAL